MAGKLEIQSLHRALDLIEIIHKNTIPLKLKDLTIQTGLPKTTVYRLLRNLESRNYLYCDNSGAYHLGLQLLIIGQATQNNLTYKQLARKALENLRALSQETAHLAILENNRVLYIDAVESPHSLRLVGRVGSTNSVHYTALGKVLLMQHPDEEIVHILQAEGMEGRTNKTRSTPEAYLQDMQKVRQQGYAFDDQESQIQCRCVGAPIFDNTGKIAAAISVSGLASRFSVDFIEQDIIPALLQQTQEISHLLGWQP